MLVVAFLITFFFSVVAMLASYSPIAGAIGVFVATVSFMAIWMKFPLVFSGNSIFSPKYVKGLQDTVLIQSAQLKGALASLENAIVKVCGSFHDIARKARDTISDPSGKKGGLDLQTIINEGRETLEDLLNRIQEKSNLSLKTLARMEGIQVAMKEIVHITDEVEAIAENTKLLALNARIEATRMGEQGKGFTVISDEITVLAKQCTETGVRIRELAQKLNYDWSNAFEELQGLASSEMDQAQRSQRDVHQALSLLTQAYGDLQNAVESANYRSQSLSQDISQAVMALQFQDIVNQRVIHVIEALEDIGQDMNSYLKGKNTLGEDPEERFERLAKPYTMASERQALARQLGVTNVVQNEKPTQYQSQSSHQAPVATTESGLGDNVELF